MRIQRWFLLFATIHHIVSSIWCGSSDRWIYKEIWLSIVYSFFSFYRRFLTDSSGTYTEYKAVSIGAGCEGATDMLKDLYKPVSLLFFSLC